MLVFSTTCMKGEVKIESQVFQRVPSTPSHPSAPHQGLAVRDHGATVQGTRRRTLGQGYLRGYAAGAGMPGAHRAPRFRVR